MKEFIAAWFESLDGWLVQTSDRQVLGPFGSIGECLEAMVPFGFSESAWTCVDDIGDYYHYERDE